MDAPFIYFHVPEDKELLAAIGEVTLRHEHLSHVLRMTIRSLLDISVDEALEQTRNKGPSKLRTAITEKARRHLGSGEPFNMLEALLLRCREASDRRNEFIHSIWGKELDGELVIRDGAGPWQPPPSLADLRGLSIELHRLQNAIISARADGGWLAEAIANPREP